METYPEVCARIHGAGHEIGHHGYLHEPPATLTREQEEAVLRRGSTAIRRITGSDPRGYRSPSWDLSPHTVDLLLAGQARTAWALAMAASCFWLGWGERIFTKAIIAPTVACADGRLAS